MTSNIITSVPCNTTIGNKFEQHALNYLQNQGAELICRQYRTKLGEIDLIVNLHNTILFVEVRARKSQKYGGAIYSIAKVKQQKIIATANIFLQEYVGLYSPTNYTYRFDVIIFEQGKIQWLQNCMEE